MLYRSLLGAMVLVALSIPSASAQLFDNSKYPDWSGQWRWVPDGDVPRYDHTKPIRGQQAPLKPEYQALFEASIKDQDLGGFGLDTNYACIPQTMPRLMNGIVPFEFVVSPDVTHILYERMNYQGRRIYTDGRPWPKEMEPISTGYSVAQWLDTDGDGRFDTLAIETRNIRGPKTWDQSGMPMADDNERPSLEDVSKLHPDPSLGLERNGARASGESLLIRISMVKSCICDSSGSAACSLGSSMACAASPFPVTGEFGALSVPPSSPGLVI